MYVSRIRIKGDRRMIKYTRTQINKNALIHDKQFVTVDDALDLMNTICKAAVEAGADEVKLKELVNE